MATTNFAPALKAVLVHEGGWSDNPRDNGGATMYGVTQRVYDAFRDRAHKTRQSVRAITYAEVEVIYRQQYWDVVRGDKLPHGIDYVVFDAAVNSGPRQAVRWLQRALKVRADGVMGNVTLAAVEAHPDYAALIDTMLDLRLAMLKAHEDWDVFGKGWSRRVAGVRRHGLALATSQATNGPIFVPDGNKKAEPERVCVPNTAPGDIAASGGIATTTLTQVIDALTPIAHVGQVAHVVTALTVLGVLLTIAGLAYRSYRDSQRKTLLEAL